jgi:hypothetical protein
MKQKHTILTVSLLAAIVTSPFTAQVVFAEPTIKFDQGAKQQGKQNSQQQREGARQERGKKKKQREQSDDNKLGSKTDVPT